MLELQIECGRALLDAGRLADLAQWLPTVRRRPPGWANATRRGVGRLPRDDLDQAETLLFRVELADIREGETTLTDLWFAIRAKRITAAEGVPLDKALDGKSAEPSPRRRRSTSA